MFSNFETFCILGKYVELQLNVPKIVEFPCEVGSIRLEILWGHSDNIPWEYSVPDKVKNIGYFLIFEDSVFNQVDLFTQIMYGRRLNRLCKSLPCLEDYIKSVYPNIRHS